VRFAVDDEVLLDTEHACAPPIMIALTAFATLDGPLQGARVPGAHCLGAHLHIPATWRVFPEFNVKRLCPYLRRSESRAARAPGRRASAGPARCRRGPSIRFYRDIESSFGHWYGHGKDLFIISVSGYGHGTARLQPSARGLAVTGRARPVTSHRPN
jgi:hypothetical protein